MWHFIMHAGYNYDLYQRGQERILVDKNTMRVSFYYLMNGEVYLI